MRQEDRVTSSVPGQNICSLSQGGGVWLCVGVVLVG